MASWRYPRVGRLRSNGNELEVSSGCSENSVQGLCNGGASWMAQNPHVKGKDYEVSLVKLPKWPSEAGTTEYHF